MRSMRFRPYEPLSKMLGAFCGSRELRLGTWLSEIVDSWDAVLWSGGITYAERSEFAYTEEVVCACERRGAEKSSETRTSACGHLRDAIHQGVRAGREALEDE